MNDEALIQFASSLRGSVTAPADDAYDDARKIWNGTVDRKPALIVSCKGVADVIEAVNFARENGLGVSVRSGGHHVAGAALIDAGMVVDLAQMRSVRVEPSSSRARCEGGALIGDVDRETQAFGLAVPLGVVSETGVAGLTLAGGYGWLRRKHGLSCDNLISADVVTADGRLLTASAEENTDLYWAIRGGGWDMGVVTSFEYKAYSLGPEVYLPFLTYPYSEGANVLRRLREFVASAPREVGALAVCWTFPEAEVFPRELWGQQFIGIAGPYAGPADEGERACQGLRELGTVLTDMSGIVPYVVAQQFFDEDYPKGRRYYWKSAHLKHLDDDAIRTLLDLAGRRPSPLTSLDIWINGGAIADVAPDATPVGHRDAPFMIGIESNWDGPAEDAANIAWAREAAKSLAPFSTGGSYLNFEDLDEAGAVQAAHGANFQRLVEVKRRYDPANLFRSRRGLVD
jgi:hypothetical protein